MKAEWAPASGLRQNQVVLAPHLHDLLGALSGTLAAFQPLTPVRPL